MQSNWIFSTVILLISLFSFGLSRFLFIRGEDKKALLLLIFGGFALRFFMSSDPFLHAWDERYHALVAKNVISHPWLPTLYDHPILPYDFRNWSANYIWVHKPPIPVLSMALSMHFFGVNEFALRLPSMILSSMGIWFCYQLAVRLFDKKVAWMAGFLFAIQGMVLEVGSGRTATDHYDLFFLIFILIAVYFSVRAVDEKSFFWYASGVFLALALMTKWLPALLVFPLAILYYLHRKKRIEKELILGLFKIFIVAIGPVVYWQFYIFQHFPTEATWEASFNARHLTEVLDEQGGSIFYHFDKMRILFGELVYLPLIMLIYRAFKEKKNVKLWFLVTWIMVPFLFFSIAQTKMQAYTLFTAPALVITISAFYVQLIENHKKYTYPKLVTFVAFLLWALPVRYTFERAKFFQLDNGKIEATNFIKNQRFKKEKVVIVSSDMPIEWMFYKEVIAYEDLPRSVEIQRLKQDGYLVYEEIKSNEQWELIKL